MILVATRADGILTKQGMQGILAASFFSSSVLEHLRPVKYEVREVVHQDKVYSPEPSLSPLVVRGACLAAYSTTDKHFGVAVLWTRVDLDAFLWS